MFIFASEAHAEFSTLPASRLVKIPDKISFEQAATAMIQGMTAHYLVHTTGRVQPGTKVLVHAAAGGTGTLLCQAAKNAGKLFKKLIVLISSNKQYQNYSSNRPIQLAQCCTQF